MIPSLADIASFFSALTTPEVLVGLAVTASILVLFADWRLSLLALAVQYLLVTVLLATVIQLQVAIVRLIAGGLVAAMLYLTASRAGSRRKRAARQGSLAGARQRVLQLERGVFMIGLPFRLIALVLVGVSVVAAAVQYPFPNAPLLFWLVSLWLCATGLLLMASARDALKLGMGLLTFTSGFGVLYLSLDPNLLFYGLLVISDLVVALVVAHLASAPVRVTARRHGET